LPGDSWIAVRVEQSADRQGVIDALFAAGSQGVQEDGAAIVTHFPPGTDVAAIEEAIRRLDETAVITVSDAPRLDWSAWRANVGEHRLGRITIAPPWLASASDDSIVISIDPAMAFGTGEHATTRGVIRLMQRIQVPGVVADLGSGSAVLSICAAKLGANRVAAIELDHDAIGNAQENVDANGVSKAVTVIEGEAASLLPLVAPVGLVLANIISSVLLDLLELIRDSLTDDGHAILSGILVTEREMMIDAIARAQFEIVDEDTEEGWWSVLLALPQ
jgi:ribosomal protein L11 methyltransferase